MFCRFDYGLWNYFTCIIVVAISIIQRMLLFSFQRVGFCHLSPKRSSPVLNKLDEISAILYFEYLINLNYKCMNGWDRLNWRGSERRLPLKKKISEEIIYVIYEKKMSLNFCVILLLLWKKNTSYHQI